MTNVPLSPGLLEQDIQRGGMSCPAATGGRFEEMPPGRWRSRNVQPCSPKPCTETSHSPSQVDMSIPTAQQLPHQPPVLPDAVLDVNFLLLQGNKALSPPAVEQPQPLLSDCFQRLFARAQGSTAPWNRSQGPHREGEPHTL